MHIVTCSVVNIPVFIFYKKVTNFYRLGLTSTLKTIKLQISKSSHELNVFRRQGCPHLGQGHGPIVSSRRYKYPPEYPFIFKTYSNVFSQTLALHLGTHIRDI